MGHGVVIECMQACCRAYCDEKECHFGNGDPARQGPWMAMWVVQAHREKWIGCMGAAEFGLDSTEVRGWALCPVALGLSCPGSPKGSKVKMEGLIRVTSPGK